LKQVILNEINQYDGVSVEFVSGATPKVHLFDNDGNDIDSFGLGDINLEEVLALFELHKFKLFLKNKIEHDSLPNSVTEVGNVYYEFYQHSVNYDQAKSFAESKQKGDVTGRLLSYNCSFQEAHIRKWLRGFDARFVWLGGKRNSGNLFSWTEGPLAGIVFQDNATQYSNWVIGEPNNANGNENCVVQNLRELSGWNDVNCETHSAHIVVEFGKTIVPCPKINEEQRTQELHDPNFPDVPERDEENL